MKPLRFLAFATLCLAVAACAARKEFVAPNAPVGTAEVQPIYLATDRVLTEELAGTTRRGGRLSFARYDITIPLDHRPGQVEFSASNPDPATSFTVSASRGIPAAAEFGRLVRAGAGPSRRPKDSIVVFIHGFNTSLEDAVFRHAQIAHDYDLFGPQVTFTWPSIQRPLGYVRDRDSVLIARDRLEELLALLTAEGQDVFVFAHSMGALLTVETLRQLSITGRRDVLGRIGGVILISPDIDVDLFETQHARIDPFPHPFVVMTSASDFALRFSALLTGQPERLGSARDLERLAALDLLVLDLSGLPNARDHFLAATSPTVIDIVNATRADDAVNPFPRRGIIDVATFRSARSE